MVLSLRKSVDWFALVIIIGLGLTLSLLPLLIGGIFEANDLVSFHLKTALHFTQQFWAGELYPRWLIDMNGGLGSPIFFFQGPVSYYITSFFSLIFKDSKGWLPLVFSSSLALIISGFTTFLWLKETTNRAVAIFGAIIYMILPYHLAVDMYWRFSLTELWSFAWLPLLLYLTIKIIQGERFSLISYSICYAALILTQLSAGLIFGLVPIGYILILTNKNGRPAVLKLLLGTLWGIGLSAIYWYPAYQMQNNIALSTDKIFFYTNNFLFKVPNEILDPQLWKYLEVITILTAVVAGCAWAIARYNYMAEYVLESYYWFVLVIISTVMCTPLGQPIWLILPPLHSISLPWIFNIILVISTTALISLAAYTTGNPMSILINNPIKIAILSLGSVLLAFLIVLPIYSYNLPIPKANNTVLLIAIILLIAVAISYMKIVIDFSHHRTLIIGILLIISLSISSAIVISQRISNKPRNITQELNVSIDPARYRLRWVPPKLFNVGYLKSYTKNPNKAKFLAGEGSIKIQNWKPNNMTFEITAKKDSVIKVNQYYYPGWTASLIGKDTKILPTKPSENDGLIQFNIPGGNSVVSLNREVTPIERMGQIITLLSILGLGGWLFFFLSRKPKTPKLVPVPQDSTEDQTEFK